MHLELSGFLKQVFPITKFFDLYFNKNSDKLDSVGSELDSPHQKNLSYF